MMAHAVIVTEGTAPLCERVSHVFMACHPNQGVSSCLVFFLSVPVKGSGSEQPWAGEGGINQLNCFIDKNVDTLYTSLGIKI